MGIFLSPAGSKHASVVAIPVPSPFPRDVSISRRHSSRRIHPGRGTKHLPVGHGVLPHPLPLGRRDRRGIPGHPSPGGFGAAGHRRSLSPCPCVTSAPGSIRSALNPSVSLATSRNPRSKSHQAGPGWGTGSARRAQRAPGATGTLRHHRAFPTVQPILEMIPAGAWGIRSGAACGDSRGWSRGPQDLAGDTQELAPGSQSGQGDPAAAWPQKLGRLRGDARNQPWDGFGTGSPSSDANPCPAGTQGRARAVLGPGLMSPGTEGTWRAAFPVPGAAAFPAARLRALQCSSPGSAAVCESHQYFMELLPPGEGLLSAPAFCRSQQQGTADFLPPAPSRSPLSSSFHTGKYPWAFQGLRILKSLSSRNCPDSTLGRWHLPSAPGVSTAPGWVTKPTRTPKSTSSSGMCQEPGWIRHSLPSRIHPAGPSWLPSPAGVGGEQLRLQKKLLF